MILRFEMNRGPNPVAGRHRSVARSNPFLLFALLCLLAGVFCCLVETGFAQRTLRVEREVSLQGTFESLVGDELTIRDLDGQLHRLRIQVEIDEPIGLSGGDIALDQPARIQATGNVSATAIQPGMVLEVTCLLGRNANLGAIEGVRLLPVDSVASGVQTDTIPEGQDMVTATISGVVKSLQGEKLVLNVDRHELVPRTTLTFNISDFGEVSFATDSLGLLEKGDVVSELAAAELSTGDSVGAPGGGSMDRTTRPFGTIG